MPATAAADDSDTFDPTYPGFWEEGENAGGTGIAPLPTDSLFWKEGDNGNAGGTGVQSGPSGVNPYDTGQDAGGV